MLMLLSPSKTLDFEGPRHEAYSQPEMLDQTAILARKMKRFSSRSLQKLLDISENLGDLNHQRYQEFELPLTPETARQALMAFKGDSYHHFDLDRFTEEDWSFAQRHLRILSGLYGVLRPMDLIRPYRLEMGTALKTPRGARLTDFWGDRITEALNAALAELDPPHLLNLASQQYFDAVRPRALKASIIHVEFRERKGDTSKIISFFAKRARGAMAHYVIRNRIGDVEGIKAFDLDGYRFDTGRSTPDTFVFLRDQET